MFVALVEKIKKKEAKVSVIGLGYVGLPLAVEFAKAGFRVTGIDVDSKKVNSINKGKSYIPDVSDADIKQVVLNQKLRATTDYSVLKGVDTVNICVPTPLRKTREPDISYIVMAAEEIKKYLKKGQLIVLESTTYPGTTEEVILPMLESTGFKVGEDFFLAFSPERVDPGNKNYKTKNIPKVVGGVTRECTDLVSLLYEQVVKNVIVVSSAQAAELVKLLENTFRSVNIALVNEFAIMCNKFGVDVWEVISAAATKPFGFMPFYPGPGLGGHCIPIDPLYLTWKARLNGYEPRFIELAAEVNRLMPDYVVTKIADALNNKEKCIKSSKILVLGVAYKKNVSDYRESPALEIIHRLKEKGAKVLYNDPYVEEIKADGLNMKSSPLNKKLLKSVDCTVIITDHTCYDYKSIVLNSDLLVDTRNATGALFTDKKKIVKL